MFSFRLAKPSSLQAFKPSSLQEGRATSWLALRQTGLPALPLLGIAVCGVTMASVQAWLPASDRRSNGRWYEFDTYSGHTLPLDDCVSEERLPDSFSGVLLLTRRGCESCERLQESGELPRLVDSLHVSNSVAVPALVRLDADEIADCLLVETPANLQLREGRLWRELNTEEILETIRISQSF